MTIDDFIDKLTDISASAQRKLARASLDRRYLQIPVDALGKLYGKYRNFNLTTPTSPWELVGSTFSFVELAVSRRLGELYRSHIDQPDSWPAAVEAYRTEVAELEAAIISDMELEFSRSR